MLILLNPGYKAIFIIGMYIEEKNIVCRELSTICGFLYLPDVLEQIPAHRGFRYLKADRI